jgi:hypothetical protein
LTKAVGLDVVNQTGGAGTSPWPILVHFGTVPAILPNLNQSLDLPNKACLVSAKVLDYIIASIVQPTVACAVGSIVLLVAGGYCRIFGLDSQVTKVIAAPRAITQPLSQWQLYGAGGGDNKKGKKEKGGRGGKKKEKREEKEGGKKRRK